jgi:hypothetical protein
MFQRCFTLVPSLPPRLLSSSVAAVVFTARRPSLSSQQPLPSPCFARCLPRLHTSSIPLPPLFVPTQHPCDVARSTVLDLRPADRNKTNKSPWALQICGAIAQSTDNDQRKQNHLDGKQHKGCAPCPLSARSDTRTGTSTRGTPQMELAGLCCDSVVGRNGRDIGGDGGCSVGSQGNSLMTAVLAGEVGD